MSFARPLWRMSKGCSDSGRPHSILAIINHAHSGFVKTHLGLSSQHFGGQHSPSGANDIRYAVRKHHNWATNCRWDPKYQSGTKDKFPYPVLRYKQWATNVPESIIHLQYSGKFRRTLTNQSQGVTLAGSRCLCCSRFVLWCEQISLHRKDLIHHVAATFSQRRKHFACHPVLKLLGWFEFAGKNQAVETGFVDNNQTLFSRRGVHFVHPSILFGYVVTNCFLRITIPQRNRHIFSYKPWLVLNSYCSDFTEFFIFENL